MPMESDRVAKQFQATFCLTLFTLSQEVVGLEALCNMYAYDRQGCALITHDPSISRT